MKEKSDYMVTDSPQLATIFEIVSYVTDCYADSERSFYLFEQLSII